MNEKSVLYLIIYILFFCNDSKKDINWLTVSSFLVDPQLFSSRLYPSILWTSLMCFFRLLLFFHAKTRPQNSQETSFLLSSLCRWRVWWLRIFSVRNFLSQNPQENLSFSAPTSGPSNVFISSSEVWTLTLWFLRLEYEL